MANRLLIGIFTAAALSYLLMLSIPDYTLQPLHKALPIFILLFVVLRSSVKRKMLLSIALLFSAIGDICLALSFEHQFQAGLGAFACAQLSYFVFFIKEASWTKHKRTAISLIAIVFIAVGSVIVPSTGELMWLVLFYTSTLMLMTCSAVLWSRSSYLPIVGAGVFVLSDSLIAINKFVIPLPLESYLIMVTYYVAQCCIVLGVLSQSNASRQN